MTRYFESTRSSWIQMPLASYHHSSFAISSSLFSFHLVSIPLSERGTFEDQSFGPVVLSTHAPVSSASTSTPESIYSGHAQASYTAVASSI